MGNYRLKNISPVGNTDLSQGIFIILFNVTNIPPHLLISIYGKIYSITDSGRQLGSSLEKLLLFIERKVVPAIFVEWIQLESCSEGIPREKLEKLKSLVHDTFLKYDRVVEGKISCLFPIRDIIAEVLGSELKKANFIFELLPMMEKENAIGKVFAINMGSTAVNGEFELLTYTNEEMRVVLRESK